MSAVSPASTTIDALSGASRSAWPVGWERALLRLQRAMMLAGLEPKPSGSDSLSKRCFNTSTRSEGVAGRGG